MNSETPRLCIDCQYVRIDNEFTKRYTCSHEKNMSLVDGAPSLDCFSCRLDFSFCKKAGLFFKPKV